MQNLNRDKRLSAMHVHVLLAITLVSGFVLGKEPPRVTLLAQEDSNGGLRLASSKTGPWKVVKLGESYEGYTVQTVSDEGWVALERDSKSGGEILYVSTDANVPLRVKKLLGKVGAQIPPEIPERSRQYWRNLLDAEKDILAEQYLADPRDPSYERTKNWLAPFEFPHGYVGTLIGDPRKIIKGSPHEVHVAWDGSVSLDRGFFTGREPFLARLFSPELRFALNGKEISREESLMRLFRAQLNVYLPITQFIYQRGAEELGWEQIVMMSEYLGKPVLLLRFRLQNTASEPQQITLSAIPPPDAEFSVRNDRVEIAVPYTKFERPRGADEEETGSAGGLSELYKDLQRTKAISRSTLNASKSFAKENNRPVWHLELPGSGSADLYFYLPGYHAGGPVVIPPDQIQSAFFTALKREKENWDVVFEEGPTFKIPEPEISDINRAVLAKLWITNDGDELRGGGIHYEGFWPYTAIESCKLMLDLGYFNEVKFYLKHFLDTRIEPSGLFRFDWGAWRHQIYDIGYFLHCLSNYYWYTADGTFFEKYEEEVDLLVGMIEGNRQRSKEAFPDHDPRHGMLIANMNNDFREKSYFYSSDAPVCMGIRAYAEALAHFGTALKISRLRDRAKELAAYASDYFALLRRSFESCGAVERQGDTITYIHHIPLPPEWPRPALDSPYRKAGSTLRAHTRFHEFPRLAESGLLNEEELRALFEYESNHERTVLGLKRFVPERLDDFRTYHAGVQKLRLGLVREYLMHYYAYLNYILIPDLWIGLEQSVLIPEEGRRGRDAGSPANRSLFEEGEDFIKGTRIQGWDGIHPLRPVLTETKQMFAFDEPGGGAVWIGRAIPNHWLTSGEEVGAEGLTTRYGKLDLSMHYESEKRVLEIMIRPKQERVFPELRVGVRDPEGGKASEVECVGSPETKYSLDKDQDLVYVQDVKGPLLLRVKFDK